MKKKHLNSSDKKRKLLDLGDRLLLKFFSLVTRYYMKGAIFQNQIRLLILYCQKGGLIVLYNNII